MRPLCSRHQRTLARPAQVEGVGYLTGRDVRIRFLPASTDWGVRFVRTDLTARPVIPAHFHQVTGTARRTTLGHPPRHVSLVEHVLAALAGLRIDNCCVELDAPEPPGLDGSARSFALALLDAGICLQPAQRTVWTSAQSVVVRQGGATLVLHPADGSQLKISYHLDYGVQSPLCRQRHTEVITPETFVNNLARSRTFLLEAEAAEFKRQGLGPRSQARDLLVFGKRGPIDNRLHFANEPARHKILDVIGDLALLNHDVCGHIVAYRSGHPLNVELVRTLANQLPGECRLAA